MALPNLSKVGNDIWKWTAKHSPEILTGMGVVGMVSSIVLAVKATPKALSAIEEKKKEESVQELKPVEVVQATWKCYIPTAATSAVSIACIIGASSVNHKRNAALATAYSLVDSSFRTYREKVVEAIGEKKEQEVRDEVAKEEIKHNPVKNSEIIFTGADDTLCYDPTSGRYFKINIDKVHKVEAELNKELYSDMFVSLNEYYEKIGLPTTDIGDELGWDANVGPVEFSYSSQIASNGSPCLIISFTPGPRWDYRNMY